MGEEQRDQDGNGCGSTGDNGQSNLVRALNDSFDHIQTRFFEAGYIFEDDDGGINHHTHSQNNGGERDHIEFGARLFHQSEGDAVGEGHGDDGDQRKAGLADEEEDDEGGQKQSLSNIAQQIGDRSLGEGG